MANIELNGKLNVHQIFLKGEDILTKVWPVGSIYMSTNSTSPASMFGGVWGRIEDRFLLCAGSSFGAGATGGEREVVLTVDQIPAHSHIQNDQTEYNIGPSDSVNRYTSNTLKTGQRYVNTGSCETNPAGGGRAHNNMPPYIAVYVWKRTE